MKTITDKLCENAGIPERETAKAMNMLRVLDWGIPEHQEIVRNYLEMEGKDVTKRQV